MMLYVTSRSTFQNNSVALTNETKTAFQSDSGQNQTIIRDITVSRSTDGPIAQNFTTPVQVGNDRWFMNGCPDAGPGFDFDKSGNIHIAWFTGSEFAPRDQDSTTQHLMTMVLLSTSQYQFTCFQNNGFHQQPNI